MNNFFKSEEHQKLFDKNGYIIIDFFNEKEVKEMLNFLYESEPDLKTGKFTSIFHWDYNLNKKLNDFLAKLISPKLSDVLPNWQVLNGSYIVKSTADVDGTSFSLHQDFNLVLDTDLPTIGMWIALDDTNKDNGGLCVIPGSHNIYKRTIRGVNIPTLYIDFDEEVNQITEYLEVKKGQVCLFAHSLFHGSPNNSVNTIRPVIHAGIFPPSFTRVHYDKAYDKKGNEVIEEIEISHDYYCYNLPKFYEDPRSGPYKFRRIMKDFTPKPTRESVLASYGIISKRQPIDVPTKKELPTTFVQKAMNLFKRK